MIKSHNLPIRGLALVLLLAGALSPISGRDREFSTIVRAVETTYHTKRNYRFLSWFAGVAVKVARPEGVGSLKMAIFEGQDFSSCPGDAVLEETIQSALAEDWRPMVRVWSKRDGEHTHIYTREIGKDIQLLIVTVEETEAVVLQAKMSAKKFAEMINDPETMGGSLHQDAGYRNVRKASAEVAAGGGTFQKGESAARKP